MIAGITGSAMAADGASALEKCFDAFSAAEPIFAEMQQSIQDEMNAADDDDSEFSPEEGEAVVKELQDYIKQLDKLISEVDGITVNAVNDAVNKTVDATRDYLTILKNISYDMHELVAYSLDFYTAVLPMEEFDDNVESYEELADEIYANTEASLEMLNKIKPPPYLAISHNDLIARVRELQDFAVDFYTAALLGDPLRTYSCVFRMNRIQVMFTQCGDNLNSDMLLQFEQAEFRLKGTVLTLRNELSAYFALPYLKKGGK
jgi:hypothetical protein